VEDSINVEKRETDGKPEQLWSWTREPGAPTIKFDVCRQPDINFKSTSAVNETTSAPGPRIYN
jgi:hypothetical protein